MTDMLKYYQEHTADFLVKKHSEKDLYIVKYKHSGIDWEQPHALDARGIVLDGKGEVVARPYRKFFNYNELVDREGLSEELKKKSQWKKEPFEVYEKLDGSLVTAFLYEGEVMFASSGSLEGAFPDKFRKWFEENFTEAQWENLKKVLTHHTLLFEYVGPDNRIVVPYNESNMVLHGIVETKGGREIAEKLALEVFAWTLQVDMAKPVKINSLDELLKLQKEGTAELSEGFVIVFAGGEKLKIKTEEYVELHYTHTLPFGKVGSKKKINLYIEAILDDTIDDILPIFKERGDTESIKFINRLIGLCEEFRAMEEEAERIRESEGFDKKEYAVEVGTSTTMDKLVLGEPTGERLDRIRKTFITEELKKRGN